MARKPKEKKSDVVYTATLVNLGKKYTAKGSTVFEAIDKLNAKVKGKSVLTVSNGIMERTKILTPQQSNRLFLSQGLMRTVALKNTSILFEGL